MTAFKLSQRTGMPVHGIYWEDAVAGRVVFGVRDAGTEREERLLVRSAEEYTSCVQNVYAGGGENGGDYIVMTENSIYLVPNNIESRHIGA